MKKKNKFIIYWLYDIFCIIQRTLNILLGITFAFHWCMVLLPLLVIEYSSTFYLEKRLTELKELNHLGYVLGEFLLIFMVLLLFAKVMKSICEFFMRRECENRIVSIKGKLVEGVQSNEPARLNKRNHGIYSFIKHRNKQSRKKEGKRLSITYENEKLKF